MLHGVSHGVEYNATKLKRLERKRTPTEGKVSQPPNDSGKRTRILPFAGDQPHEGNPLFSASTMEPIISGKHNGARFLCSKLSET